MLGDIAKNYKSRLDRLRKVVVANSRVRESAIQGNKVVRRYLAWRLNGATLPDLAEADHCHFLLRSYNLWEQGVKEIISEYLNGLSRVHSDFSSCPEALRRNLRKGIGQALSNWGDKSLLVWGSERKLLGDYLNVLNSRTRYRISAEALISTRKALRSGIVVELFSSCGISDAWKAVEAASSVKTLLEKGSLDHQSASTALEEFVELRNQAAHGDVMSLLSQRQVEDFATLIELGLEALESFSLYTLVRRRESCRCGGKVTEVFPNNGAHVITCNQFRWRVGQRVYWYRGGAAGSTKVTSLMNFGKPQNTCSSREGQELGVKFETPLKKNTLVYGLHKSSAQTGMNSA